MLLALLLVQEYNNANIKKDASGQGDESVDAATVERADGATDAPSSADSNAFATAEDAGAASANEHPQLPQIHAQPQPPQDHEPAQLSSRAHPDEPHPPDALDHEQYTRVLRLRAHGPALAQRLTRLRAQVAQDFGAYGVLEGVQVWPWVDFPCPSPCLSPFLPYPTPIPSLPVSSAASLSYLPLPFSLLRADLSLPPLPFPSLPLLVPFFPAFPRLPPSLLSLSLPPSPARFPSSASAFALLCFCICPSLLPHTQFTHTILLQIPCILATLRAHCLATIFDHHFLSNGIYAFTHDHGVKPE
ncbi:hypothetical protein B0H14DRAFT_3450359 [Mycena olivaceomarginata]|nr:hypothetical protein B0H14DRAFT_3450359 [Mycena olivaceomarginata]